MDWVVDPRATLPLGSRVLNATGTTSDTRCRVWVELCGRGYKCQIKGCSNYARCGGHMHVQGMPMSLQAILPICDFHNDGKATIRAWHLYPDDPVPADAADWLEVEPGAPIAMITTDPRTIVASAELKKKRGH
jgi:hypothetical protein